MDEVRTCTCGALDYRGCFCNLTPKEWLEYAKTNPLANPDPRKER